MTAPPLTAESLKANTQEGDPWYGPDVALGKCWEGYGGSVCRFGYRREDYWIKGLQKQRRLSTHILAWLLDHLGPLERDALFLAYLEFRSSGLQLDHICENAACRRPSHLQPLTQSENIRAGKERQYLRDLAKPPTVHYEPEEAMPF